MKKFFIIPFVTLFAFLAYLNMPRNFNSEIRNYTFKNIKDSKAQASANDAIEYNNSLYRDVITNKIETSKLAAAKDEVRQRMMSRSTNLAFIEEGPDNVGGRTRAIAMHPDNSEIMFAGSVSGGLFKTTNGGTNWNRVQEFDDTMETSAQGTGSLGISSITFSGTGDLYVATGCSKFEGGVIAGDGLWVSKNIDSNSPTFTQVSGTNNKEIFKVVSVPSTYGDIYYVGANIGLKKIDNLNANPTGVSVTGIPTNATIGDVKVSEDGNVIILGVDQGGVRTWISYDAGSSWTNLHSNGELTGTGMLRSEYAISKYKNSNNAANPSDSAYVLYALFANSAGQLGGVFRSDDNGVDWVQIAPASTTNFSPLSSTRSNQGGYNLVVTSTADGEECIIGGIDLWSWIHTPNSVTENGQWYPISSWWASPSMPFYVHADNHRLFWKNDFTLMVGNDGGVQSRFGASGPNQLTSVINKGYNVTQFYSMGFGGDGSVIGGAQDNGTQYKNNSSSYSKEFAEVSGGDGFECEISYLNSDAIITTVYNGSISRSSDKGTTSQSVPAPCTGIVGQDCGPFYNAIALMETPEDLNTQDSVIYVPSQDMNAGDTITYFSSSFGIPIKHVLSQNINVYDTMNIVGTDTFITVTGADTLTLPDYVQSYFITQNDASVYITRDMMRFTTNPEWWRLFNYNSSIKSFEISHNMDYAWCGNYGSLIRVSGLANAYSKQAADLAYRPSPSDTLIEIATGNIVTGSFVNQINFANDGDLYTYKNGSPIEYTVHYETVYNVSGRIEDISVDPSNPDNVCIVTGGTSSSHVFYSTNATSDNPTFSSIDGDLPDMPVLGCIIERDPTTDIIVIGTAYGVFTTDNINGNNTNWVANNSEIGAIPVYDICQQWRDWEDPMEGGYRKVNNPGAIYACTYGRGIWRADNLLSIQEPIEENTSIQNISSTNIYPNPVSQNTNLSFDLNKSSLVSISIYNLNGSLVKTIYSNVLMNTGNNNIPLSTSDLSMGTYLVVVNSDQDKNVVKFVKY
ncbi:MAG: T9SS type A sorting domain-containing protein [Flavobacteriales bacterium]|nr:T9SS type A sorting domain-containing protein [Flavobacteriales bacterium]